MGLVASRRQIEFNGGYVNNWNTRDFCKHVRELSDRVILVRDHGGPGQGAQYDDGRLSMAVDAMLMDIIHVDPWLEAQGFQHGLEMTRRYVEFCHSINREVKFEVGTEEKIYKYSPDQLDTMLRYLKSHLSTGAFEAIEYAVIQSGTVLFNGENQGEYDKDRLLDMVSVCRRYRLTSKEHNGDFLSDQLIAEKFRLGLDSINIAPEFGTIETRAILGLLDDNQRDTFFNLCVRSGKWKKWFPDGFDPNTDKIRTLLVAGHYVFASHEFKELLSGVSRDVMRETITKRISELFRL
jgi:fructose/tagatose bisphosphate aldolase